MKETEQQKRLESLYAFRLQKQAEDRLFEGCLGDIVHTEYGGTTIQQVQECAKALARPLVEGYFELVNEGSPPKHEVMELILSVVADSIVSTVRRKEFEPGRNTKMKLRGLIDS